jgi:hypothetical protein
MKLSIYIPAIRVENWVAVCNNIRGATTLPSSEYEIIFISPYDLPDELQNVPNVRLVKDWGAPTRCCQLGLLAAKGEYVFPGADDALFDEGTFWLDIALEIIPKHKKGIVLLKHLEGTSQELLKLMNERRKGKNIPSWDTDVFYRLDTHHAYHENYPLIPGHYLVLMLWMARRDYLIEMGGWDCEFEHHGIGTIDLSIRLQNDGAEVVMGPKALELGHLQSDHAEVMVPAYKHDGDLIKEIYGNPRGPRFNINKTKIDINNWKNVPEVWERRFPEGKK